MLYCDTTRLSTQPRLKFTDAGVKTSTSMSTSILRLYKLKKTPNNNGASPLSPTTTTGRDAAGRPAGWLHVADALSWLMTSCGHVVSYQLTHQVYVAVVGSCSVAIYVYDSMVLPSSTLVYFVTALRHSAPVSRRRHQVVDEDAD